MKLKRSVTLFTLLSFLFSVTLPAQAAMLNSGEYLSSSERAEQMAVIDKQLQRAEVQEQFRAMGVDPADAEQRIARLPDHEIAKLAEQMEELPAGGDALALIGAVFVVLLILELTGVINIFNSV